jgi:integrase
MNEMQADYGRGTAVERSKMTVGEYLDGWLAVQKATKAPGTYENRRYRVAYTKPFIGEIPIQALTELDVERMAACLAESGKLRGEGGLKPASVAAVVSTLVTALNDAVRKRLVPRNVAAGAYRAPSRANADDVFAWNADELSRFLKVVAEDPLYGLWRFLAFTGCRIGEAIALRWRDMDLDAGTVTIIRTRSKGIDGQITVGGPKTVRGQRTIDIDDDTVMVLQRLRAARSVVSIGDEGRDLVFTLPDGSPLHPDAVRTRMKRLVKLAGVPRLTPHGLRDTHATLLLLPRTFSKSTACLPSNFAATTASSNSALTSRFTRTSSPSLWSSSKKLPCWCASSTNSSSFALA